MGNIHPKIKEVWEWLKRNTGAVVAITAIIMVILGILTLFFSCQANRRDEVPGSRRPELEIHRLSLKPMPYPTSDGGQSVALQFFIPIRNEGNTIAYNIDIKKKVLVLPRGTYDLTDDSLQTVYTNSPFDLKPRQTIQDSIFIDENPANMEAIRKGEKEITLEYEIYFYADKGSKRDPYVCKYKIPYSRGKFQYDKVDKSIQRLIDS